MAVTLPRLVPTTDPSDVVEVQQTAFSLDVVGRYVCNTWNEAVGNGGPPFDAVVIGAGMFGAYCAEKLFRAGAGANLRILVLDAGSYLVSEHVQNLARIGLNVPSAVVGDPGPRERVWGTPWRSNVAFPGLAYCLGGRSLYWGGWSPQLTAADLARWPGDLAQYLAATYPNVAQETGVAETTDYISGDLYKEMKRTFTKAAKGVKTIDAIEDAPLAVQGQAPASGLFSFDKFSSAPIFVDAVRQDAQSSSADSSRRLFVVPHAHVTRLVYDGTRATGIEVMYNGQPKRLTAGQELSVDFAVVLAAGTIESTRLALESFPTPAMGRNLMAHLRNNVTVRIKRAAFASSLPQQLEAAALLVRGSTPQGRFHLQVTAAAVMGSNPEDVMWRMVPDIDLLQRMVSSQNADSIVITLRGIGEMTGQRGTPTGTGNWIDLSPYERDEFGMRRAWVNLVRSADDEALSKAMYDASIKLAQTIAGDPANIEYWDAGAWKQTPPPDVEGAGKVRDGLGTTHHEAGTLWAGADAQSAITDLDGRFHHVANAFVAGPAVFPTIGSANPSLTALALARRTAAAVVRDLVPAVEPGFMPLYTGTLADWQMAGSGSFAQVGSQILETEGGIGLLWYTKQQFGDFVLRADWRTASPTDNSGVFVRFPPLPNSDPANDWKLAVQEGYEIQIDDQGFNPDTNTTGDPTHRTGAVYALAPADPVPSRPPGQWNRFEIEARGPAMKVKLNDIPVSSYTADGTRPLKGYIGLQNHHMGSRVQFRNIRVQRLDS